MVRREPAKQLFTRRIIVNKRSLSPMTKPLQWLSAKFLRGNAREDKLFENLLPFSEKNQGSLKFAQFLNRKVDKELIQTLKEHQEQGQIEYDLVRRVSGYFKFDPGFLNDVIEKGAPEETVGVIANSFAWIGGENNSVESFSLVFRAIVAVLRKEFDCRMLFCLKMVTTHAIFSQIVFLPEAELEVLCKMFTENANSLKAIVPILGMLMYIALQSEGNNSIESLTKCMSVTLEKATGVNLNTVDLSDTIAVCETDIRQVDIRFVLLFTQIANSVDDNKSVLRAYRRLPKFISLHLEQLSSEVQRELSLPKLTPSKSDCGNLSLSISWDDIHDAFEKVDPISVSVFEVNTKDLMNQQQFDFLTKLRSLMSPTCPGYRSAFVQAYGQLIAKSISSTMLSANLAFLINTYAGVREKSEEFFDAIDTIFDPQYTVFCDMNMYVHKLRQLLFDTVTASSPYDLRQIVMHSDKSPLLLAETIGRIHAKLGFVDLSTIFDETIVSIITNSLVFLQSQREIIMHKAWSTIFMFIVAVLDDTNTLSVLLSHPSFTIYFLGLFPKKDFQSIVFTAMQKFLIRSKNCDIVAEFCTNMLEVASQIPKYIGDAALFISKLKDSLSVNPEIIPYFKDLAHKSLSLLVMKPTNDTLMGVLSFFAVIHMNVEGVTFEEREVVALSRVFREMEASDEGLGLLASILARRKSASYSSTFLIQNNHMLPMLLSYGDLKAAIKFISELCHYSLYNLQQCHIGGYDLFLVTLLENFGKPFIFGDVKYDPKGIDRQFVTDIIFPVLALMSEYWSSGEIAARLLCLSIPSEEGVYPDLAEQSMDVTVKTLGQIARNQVPIYQFTAANKTICFPDVNGNSISEGFTFVAWVLIDSPTTLTSSHPAIFSVYTDEESEESIILFVSGTSIHAQFASADDPGASSIIVAPDVPSGKWHMITFVYKPQCDETAKVMFNMDALNWGAFIVKKPFFEDKVVTVQIGGFISNYEICDTFSFIGPFRVLNTALKDKDKEKGVVEMLTQSIHVESISGDFLDSRQLEKEAKSCFYPLLTAVRDNSMANYLLPFLIYSETAPPHFLDMIINIMTLSHQGLDYKVLGRIVSKWSPNLLAYSTYLKFFDLLSVTNDRDLLMYVVFNPDIWYHASGNRIVKILAHWSNTLIVSHPNLVAQVFGFSQILVKALALLRSLTPDQALDREGLYRLATQLLVQYHAYEPNPSDSLHLLSHLYKSDNEREMIFLMGLFRSIGNMADIESLYFFLSHSNPDLFCETVQTILSLASEQAPQQIDMILCQMTSRHMNQELFEKILELVPKFPIVIIPAAMIAFSVDGLPDKLCPVIAKLCVNEKALNEIVQVNYWFLWLILSTLRLDTEKQNQGIVLVHSLYEHDKTYQTFDSIMCFLDIVDVTNVFDSLYFACSFLKLVCDVDISTSDDQRVNLFLQRSFRFLFFSFSKRTNFTSIFKDSPFSLQEDHTDKQLVQKGSMLVIDKPVAFLAGLLESAYKMDLNMSFCALVKPDGSEMIMNQLLVSVFDIVNQRHLRASDEFSFLNVILYFRDRKVMDARQKARELAKFNAHLGKIGVVMIFLYTKTLRATTQRILASIRSSMNACDGSSGLRSDVSALAEYEVANSNNVWKKRLENRELAWNKFIFQYMNSMSMWSHLFSQEFVLSTKSFRMSYLWDNPFMKYQHGRFARPSTIPCSSDAVRIDATYVKFNSETPCSFVLDKHKISIELRTKTIQIPTGEISCCVPKSRGGKSLSLEIIDLRRRCHLLDFGNKTLELICDRFGQFGLEHKILMNREKEVTSLLAQWSEHRLSNFALITRLNHLSGRSFRNQKLYPIFPTPILDGKIRDFEKDPYFGGDSSRWCGLLNPYKSLVSIEGEKESFLPVFQSNTELACEFYSCFECFDGLDLPSFAKDKFEFVYHLRGFLESEKCSQTIHTWISTAFGLTLSSRPPLNLESRTAVKMDLRPFISGTVKNGCFVLFRKDNTLVTYNIKDKDVKQSHVKGTALDFVYTSKSMAFINKKAGHISTLSGEEMNLGTRVNLVCECGKSLALWTYSNDIIVVDPPEVVSRFKVPLEQASCLFSSLHYGVVAMGTKSGKLCLFNLMENKLLFCIDLKGRVPWKIAVTAGFGFVLVYCFHYLAVFTINGSLIREQEISYDIIRWFPYINSHGFDFVLIGDETGKIFSLEVFNLTLSEPIFQVHSAMGILIYDTLSREIITATKDGVGYLIPYHSEETVPNL